MKVKTAVADLQRWSEDVARDPGSLSFLPLARAYRRQGRPDAAQRLCLRGLERHPENVEAHDLLALLYLDAGDRKRAADEWSMVLRLDPANFEALRGLGFCFLEDGEAGRARQHLERASLIRPDDGAVREALRLATERDGGGSSTPPAASTTLPPPPAALIEPEPWMESPAPPAPVAASEPAPAARAPHQQTPVDPARIFDHVIGGPVLGALLVDTRGLVLAGRMDVTSGDVEALSALLGGAIDEARRTVLLAHLGEWRGMLLDTGNAMLHIAPATAEAVILIAARRDAPAGWVLRNAQNAQAVAAQFLEAYA